MHMKSTAAAFPVGAKAARSFPDTASCGCVSHARVISSVTAWIGRLRLRRNQKKGRDLPGSRHNFLDEGSWRAEFAIPEDWAYGIPVEAAWNDVDKLGHVTNAAFWRWCDDVRVQYAIDAGLTVPTPDKPSFVVVKAAAEFLSPMSYRERGLMTCRTVRIGRSSMDTEHALWLNHTTAFTAKFTIVLASQKHKKSLEIPSGVRAAIIAIDRAWLEMSR